MKLPVLPALSIFSLNLTAYEVTGGYDANRRWTESVPSRDFCISGSFQPVTEKELLLLGAGNVSAGDSVLWTTCELKVPDTSESEGQSLAQTFFKENGETWRVLSLMDWNRHTGMRKYICRKFLNHDNHPTD